MSAQIPVNTEEILGQRYKGVVFYSSPLVPSCWGFFKLIWLFVPSFGGVARCDYLTTKKLVVAWKLIQCLNCWQRLYSLLYLWYVTLIAVLYLKPHFKVTKRAVKVPSHYSSRRKGFGLFLW